MPIGNILRFQTGGIGQSRPAAGRAGVLARAYAVLWSGGAGRRARYVCGRPSARPAVMTLCSSLRSWIWECVSCGWPAARQAAGLDSALCFTMPTLSTAPALNVGGASCVPLIATFGQAGTATQLPERDLGRLNMQAALTTDRVGFGCHKCILWCQNGGIQRSRPALEACDPAPLLGDARNAGRSDIDASCWAWSRMPGRGPFTASTGELE